MKQSDARLTHLSVLLAGISGFVYGGLLYFGASEDEYGIVVHPWVPFFQALHVVTVPLFVLALGMIWNYHIVAKLRSLAKVRRRSGITLVSQAIPMIVSGYALQVSVDEFWRLIWMWAHIVTSSFFSIVFVVHLLVRIKRI